MTPAVPVSTGWACLWKTNSLYKESTSMLMIAQLTGKTCKVAWNGLDVDGHALIAIVECP